eukprot:SM000045S16286  [mRNA]  locus=s45:622764:624973:- [translate_table: standard]
MRGGGTAGGGRPLKGAPEYVRRVPKFLQPYGHLLHRDGFHDDAKAAWAEYSAGGQGSGPDAPAAAGAAAEEDDDDFPEDFAGATFVPTADAPGQELPAATPSRAETEAAKSKEKGNAAFGKGKYKEAVQCFGRAIVLTPQNAVLFSNRSAAHAGLKDFKQALEDALRAVELKPDWGKAHLRVGIALHGLGRYEEAVSAYEAGLKQEPDYQQLQEALDQTKERMRKQEAEDIRLGRHQFRKRKSESVGPSNGPTEVAEQLPTLKQTRMLSFNPDTEDEN